MIQKSQVSTLVKKRKVKNFWGNQKCFQLVQKQPFAEVIYERCSLKILQNPKENKFIGAPFLIKLQACRLQFIIKKETPMQMFSCEFFEIFKNTFFTENLLTTASVDTKNSFKTEQRNHQEMFYVICDLPISDMSVIRNYLKI